MSNQKNWGIYDGFMEKTNPLQRWEEPACERCSMALKPWIDWVYHGSIGYCSTCEDFKIVTSQYEPVPDVHPKAELQRLVSHGVASLELSDAGFGDSAWLWKLHESTPVDKDPAIAADQSRRRHRGGSESLVILEHMFWSVVWNSDYKFPELIQDYLEFCFEHPHYVEFRSSAVWIGHELNLIEALERHYADEIITSLYSVYCRAKVSSEDFRRRLGFYIPKSDARLQQFGAEFLEYAQLSRVRPPTR